jgi:hypothetical protein
MTDQQLRDLLDERVVDVTMPDHSGLAWRAGRRARRRDQLVAAGCAALVAAVLTTGAFLVGTDGQTTQPSPAPGVPTPTAAETSDVVPPDSEADATYEGVPVWWSPPQQDELILDQVDSPLPSVVDLQEGPLVTSLDRAVAAFWVANRVRLIGPDGGQLAVDISVLDDLTKLNGYGYRPVHASMLSPGGEYLIFPQDHSVQVYTVATGAWREVPTGNRTTRFLTWVDDDSFALAPNELPGVLSAVFGVDGVQESGQRTGHLEPGFGTGKAQPYGLTRRLGSSQAQSWGMGLPIQVEDAGIFLSDPEFIDATVDGKHSLLAIMWNVRDSGHGGRFLQCCPVAGWLDEGTLVYESKQTDPALVAWSVGTGELGLVSRIKGRYLLASFADLSRDPDQAS